MKNIRNIIAFVVMTLLACNVQARTVEIKVSQCPKPYVENIRKMTSGLGVNDMLILNFDKAGKYEFDGSLKFRCNTTIKGLSPEKTKVIVKEGFVNGKSKMTDDVFFAIHGSTNRKVRATIKDISFELASHNGILWTDNPKYLVKIWYGDGVLVDNIVSKTQNAVLTNLDLRECENVVVQNSEFENYNNCMASGNLWSRGKQNNIVVRNNIFRKYGHDEVLAFWGGQSNTNEVTEMKDIVVEDNDFYFGNKINSKNNFRSAVFICFYHFKEDIYHFNNPCEVDNIVFRNNSITIDDVIGRDIAFFFDELATVGEIEISNNTITNTRKTSTKDNYMNDITIEACGNINNPVVIKDNTVENHGEILYDGKNSGYTFLSLKDVDVNLERNIIDSDYKMGFIWVHDGSLDIALRDNQVSGINKTATLNSKKQNNYINISAFNNTLSGDTRISCQNVNNLSLDFMNNTFNSSDYHIFLQEGADQTSVIFDNNVINSKSGSGTLCANYSGKRINFKSVSVKNNIFKGISKGSSVIGDFSKSRNKSIQGNVYY
jgi:hypothetical protein